MATRPTPRSVKKKSAPAAAGTVAPSAPPGLKLLSLPQFLQLFRDTRQPGNDMRFCFILGSGASVQSLVPTGTSLTDIWLKELHQQDRPGENETSLQAWTSTAFPDLPDFTWDRRAEFYGNIYGRRFPDNASGQAWLRQLMKNKRPSFGYSVLASILASSRHNLVITTNFDNLVHDALVALGKPRAYIAHSPEDARFIPNHEDKPRILKLHGDIDRETYNVAEMIHGLKPEWSDPLQHLLGAYTPVFVGYGGCDLGFMRFLNETYAPNAARVRPIWAYRVDPVELRSAVHPAADPPGRPDTAFAKVFAEKHQSWWLPTPGFDELMVLMAHAMDIPHAGKEILSSAERLRDDYAANLTAALHSARSVDAARWCPQLDAITRLAESHLRGPAAGRRWEEWIEHIEGASSPDERIARAREAIEALPEDPRALASLAREVYSKSPLDPEVEACLSAADELCQAKYSPDSEQALDVREIRAWLRYKSGDVTSAKPEYAAVRHLRSLALGAESPATLRARNGFALTLHAEGDYAKAEEEHRAILCMREQLLGPDHRETLASRNNLANTLLAQGKHAEAETEHREVLAARERVNGADHPYTIGSRNNLANTIQEQGRYREAGVEHLAVMKARERLLGHEHPDTLASRSNVACNLQAQGRSAEAASIYSELLVVQERILGTEHPDTLTSRSNLANQLGAQGKAKEAEKEQRAVLAIRRRLFGEDAPDTLSSRSNLAITLRSLGRFEEAVAEHTAVLSAQERVLGPSHPATVSTREILGNSYFAIGEIDRAQRELRHVLEFRLRAQGSAHPDTLASRSHVANVWCSLGESVLAENEFRAIISLQTALLGADHPSTLSSREGLAAALRGCENFAAAREVLQDVYAVRERMSGPEHPDALTTRVNLAITLGGQGNVAEAEAELRAVLGIQERLLGPEHPVTLQTKFNLAIALRELKQWSAAIDAARKVLEGWRKEKGEANPDTKLAERLWSELNRAHAETEEKETE